jgi:stage IV sporulation protein FB
MKNAWKLFNYGESPVYLKYWFLVLLLFVPTTLVLILFVSILIHEIAHARTAKKLGYKTDYIFIDIFHGGALIDGSYTENNKHSIKIAFAGPLSNLLLSLLGFLITTLFTLYIPVGEEVLKFLASFITINLLLFVINLIPIYPLDGGRITKALSNMVFGEKKGTLISGIISMSISISALIYSIYVLDYLLMIFSVIFIVSSYGQIKPKK